MKRTAVHLALAAVALATVIALPLAAAGETPAPQGQWVWDDGSTGVEFHACGDALCGRIVWLKRDAGSGAPPALDLKNPDAGLKSRRICGIDYVTGVRRTDTGEWRRGRVYDFNSGASYDLDIDSVEPGRVRMRGYKGVRMLGANLTLVRPSSPLPMCKP